jgi:hypothetical protein
MGRTSPLRSALKSVLYPHAEALGYAIDKSHQPLFTIFRRRSGSEVHLFEVQWDKSGRSRFIINFGKAPADGVVVQGASVGPGELQVHHCRPWLRLQRRRGGSMRCWFQLRRPLLEQVLTLSREYTPTEVARSVVASFEEVEAWLGSGVKGPHVHGLGSDA